VHVHGGAETRLGKALSIKFPGQQTAVLLPEDVRKCWKVDLRESWREIVDL
jgi:hypothetical protein